MEQKPITKKQMQWKVSLEVASAILIGVGFWFSHSWIQKILSGILLLFAFAIFLLVLAIRAF